MANFNQLTRLNTAAIAIALCIAFISVAGTADAFTIDWSGCGPGSMCTNDGYICR